MSNYNKGNHNNNNKLATNILCNISY